MRPIDADALKHLIGIEDAVKYENETEEQLHNSYATLMNYEIADYIDDMPTIDCAPVRHGEWVLDNTYPGKHKVKYVCSACAHWQMCHKSKEPSMNPRFMRYCPNCGAKMDGRAE